jgi:hypothetical protein
VPAEYSVTLAEGLHAPSQARSWVRAHLPDLTRSARDDVLLLVSELVTNAVRHGAPDVVLSLRLSADRIIATVQPTLERPTGRGLLIVAATSSDWGVDQRLGKAGKTVWVEVRRGSVTGVP